MPFSLITAAEIQTMPETGTQHQFNDQAVRFAKSLGDAAGLSQCGIHLVRVEPSFETTQHHRHHYCDEFIYILSGSGIAKIEHEEYASRLATLWGSRLKARHIQCAIPAPKI